MIPEIQNHIDKLFTRKDRVIVAIDGSCTAGKTTLAGKLAGLYDCNVIHMDDFFLRPHQRTPERFAEVGGNVDYERFQEEVLTPLQQNIPFSYRPFNCKTFTLSEPVAITPKRLTIIEGSYSMHPYFADPYDLKILLTVDPQVRYQRILHRLPEVQSRFFEVWIPMEQAYLKTFRIHEKCDLVF